MTKQRNEAEKKLEQIKADILNKNVCPDLAQGANQLVMGHGNPCADIVFIGEAPGKNEDMQGIPFVGSAGKLLDEMLTTINLQRNDVYITNIVKYRPPSNRDPSTDEKKEFWPYLMKELDVIRPKVIATLGRHSMEYFLPGQKIGAVHGQPKRIRINFGNTQTAGGLTVDAMQDADEQRTESYQKYDEEVADSATQKRATSEGSVSSSARKQDFTSVIILPLYHPAVALYNRGLRQTLFDDFMAVPEIIKKLNLEN